MTTKDFMNLFEEYKEEMLSDLIEFAKAESSSLEAQSLIGCESFIKDLFRKRLGIEVNRTFPGKEKGTHNLYFEFGSGRSKVFLLGHYDTVWSKGALSFRIDGNSLYGPGVYDMKGGTVIMLWILKVLSEKRLLGDRKYCIFLNCDEEIGSPSSDKPIRDMAEGSEFCLVFEPGMADGSVKTGRKGCSEYTISVKGKSSHAGLDLLSGRNAIEEMSRQIIKVQSLTRMDIGTTFNVGVCKGGERGCIVPDAASFVVNCRYLTKEQARYCYDVLRSLKPVMEGTSIEVSGEMGSMPMEETEDNLAMYEQIRTAGEEIGLKIGKAVVGGTSDGNRVSALGIPTLDGLGVCGSGAHSPEEHMFIDSLVTRAAIVSSMLALRN